MSEQPTVSTAPTESYPVAPPYQQYVEERPVGTNGFAIAAFVLSLIGGTLLVWILGGVALSQIKRSGQAGRGLAIAGIVISIVEVAVFIVLMALGVWAWNVNS
ncbi:MAG: DUF4190 domain-containing protein [Bifidobacteriaceae bacterium]|nr:DUF4190 domain-containing protein [Bifidobacteriaceae bacterium]